MANDLSDIEAKLDRIIELLEHQQPKPIVLTGVPLQQKPKTHASA